MTIFKRLLVVFLASTLALTGCTGNTTKPIDENDNTSVALGRYVEEQRTLPENIGYYHGFEKMADGTLKLFANNNKDRNVAPWYIYESKDNGTSWTKLDIPWLKELDNTSISSVDFGEDGSAYILSVTIPENIENLPEDYIPSQKLQKGDLTGTLSQIILPGLQKQLDDYCYGVSVAGNGDYLVNNYFDLMQFDKETGTLKNTYDFGTSERARQIEEYFSYDTTLAFLVDSSVKLFDLDTGLETGEVDCALVASTNGEKDPIFFDGEKRGSRLIDFNKEKSAHYFSDNTGIYRKLSDGVVIEKIVDGELTSLNMPSMTRKKFVAVEDDSFLVLYTEKGTKEHILMRYRFDASTPTVPGRQIKVYSLEDNATVRQAIGIFQRNNPDIQVLLEIGMSGQDAVTASDAIRALNTQLLNKKGPDLIILDGMPMDSYIEKGVLADLTSLAEPNIASGAWLPNIANSYKKEGKIYAVPARFGVPALGITDEGATHSENLTSMLDWAIKEAETKNISIVQEIYHPTSFIKQFYPVCAPAWFKEDGTMDTQAFSTFLQDVKKIATPESIPYDHDIMFGALRQANHLLVLNVGTMQEHRDISYYEAAIRKAGTGKLLMLPGQTKGVFIPQTVVGVRADSAQKETAIALLETILSEQVQVNTFDDGFPVNNAAFVNNAKNPYPTGDDGSHISSSYRNEDGTMSETIELQIIWPSDEYMNGILAEIRALTTSSPIDKVILDIINTQTEGYFKDTMTLENTVTAVSEKVNLYLAE